MPAFVVLSATACLAAINVANPEALIVQANTRRLERVGRFDVGYAIKLSGDASPSLAAVLSRLGPLDAALQGSELCRVPATDWRSANHARTSARNVAAQLSCPSLGSEPPVIRR